jgi:dTDP-4-amino-4,6-dideoxygalactose transaminase
MIDRIHLSSPHMGETERQLLLDAFDSNWIAPVGPQLDAFEREMATRLGARRAVGVSSGTAALHLALRLLGVGPGDVVLVPSLTFVASANAVSYVGAESVFVDSSPDTWTIDADLVADELARSVHSGQLPKVVMAVDLYGQCADYQALREACERYEVRLVEDAAEALGSTYRGRPAGNLADIGVLSFNGNKIITTSGGGMLVCDGDHVADEARYLATQARDPVPHYEHRTVGYNYRLSNLLAAIGRGQLRGLDERVEARRQNRFHYEAALKGIPGLEFMPLAPYGVSNCWLSCLLIDPEVLRVTPEELRKHLESLNIESRPLWKPLHLQPAFRSARSCGGAVCEDLYRRGLCLPSGSNLTDVQRERVIAGLLSAIPAEVRP